MKKLIFVLILFSCTQEKVEPNFNSIDGLWRFSNKNVEAEFYVITVNDKEYVDNKGWIKIKGDKYDIIGRMQIPEIHPAPLRMQLVGQNGRIDFTALCNSEFTKMEVSNYSYYSLSIGLNNANEPLIITR